MKSKLQVEETWSRGTNSRLPFDVNVMFNLSTERALARVSGCVKKVSRLVAVRHFRQDKELGPETIEGRSFWLQFPSRC